MRPFERLYGRYPYTAPEWLSNRKPGAKSPSGIPVPDWLTLEKWNNWEGRMKTRSIRWWVSTHDAQGNFCFDREKEYTIEEAVQLQLEMNERAPNKYDPALEVVMRMNLDPRYPDQQIRMSIRLPNGTGKKVKVAVFCNEGDAEEVQAAGAYVWGDKLRKNIENEEFDFDVLIAKMDQMPQLAKLGRVLGPRRLMPSPKSGTVVKDFAQGVKDFQGGVVELRHNPPDMQVASTAGRLSFGKEKLVENVKAILQQMADNRPDGAMEKYWLWFKVGSTALPSILIKPSEFPEVVPKSDY